MIFATTSGGMPAGPTRPNHDTAWKPGTVSATVGTSGNCGMRSLPPTAISLSLPPFHSGTAEPALTKHNWIWPATTSLVAGAAPL